MSKEVTALAQWFGSDRMIHGHVADKLAGKKWVGLVFAGGCGIIPLLKDARTINVNDVHHLMMNLGRCVQDPLLKGVMTDSLCMSLFHPVELQHAQETCRNAVLNDIPDVTVAIAYFKCIWMARSGAAGTPQEMKGGTSVRWEASGGDSNKRYRSAIAALETFHQCMAERCNFTTLQAFDDGKNKGPFFLDNCQDRVDNAMYVDPPFLGPGTKYTYGPKREEATEWHTQLANELKQFTKTRIVLRAYEHELIRELYRGWEFVNVGGRKQTNEIASELLVVAN